MSIKNAVIKSATIMIEDHGFLTIWLDLDYGGAGQGFGGNMLYSPSWTGLKFCSVCGHFIYRVLEIAGVERWDDLVGKTIRVDSELSKIDGIGHIVKDDWFYPTEEYNNV